MLSNLSHKVPGSKQVQKSNMAKMGASIQPTKSVTCQGQRGSPSPKNTLIFLLP